jgi:hypothetical protein
MRDFVLEAGFGIWPVFVFGLASLFYAVQFVRKRERETFYALLGFALLTLLAGGLGTVLGLQTAARYITGTPEKWLFLVGLREALNNLVAALLVVTLDALVVALCFVRGPGSSARVAEPATRTM